MFTSMMRSGAVTAYRIVPRSGTKIDAVVLAAANASRQMTTVSGNVPEALATVALENVLRWWLIGNGFQDLWILATSPGIVVVVVVAPPALGNRDERSAVEVETVAQELLVLVRFEDL